LVGPGASLHGASRRARDLSQVSLESADLSSADLSGSVLTKVDLRGAVLTGANVDGTDFTGVLLKRVISGHMSGTPAALPTLWSDVNGYLVGAGANLRNADLHHAYLAGAVLTNTDLTNANLSSSTLAGANFSYSNLNGANISNSSLSGANFTGASLFRLFGNHMTCIQCIFIKAHAAESRIRRGQPSVQRLHPNRRLEGQFRVRLTFATHSFWAQ
jgi:uncharacterized protein YjbI with pentapeptide repeats